MAGVFTGEYRHSVDDKGRIAVPSKFRAQLDGGAVVSRWLDSCWRSTRGRAGTPLPTRSRPCRSPTGAGSFSGSSSPAPSTRRSTAGAGSSSRPSALKAAGLQNEAVVVGSRDHAEIWAPARWDDYRRSLRGHRVTREDPRGPWDLGVPHALRGPLGSVRRTWRDEGRAPPVLAEEVISMLSPAIGGNFRSTPRSAAVGTPSGSWRRPIPMAASRPRCRRGGHRRSRPACGRDSATGWSCAGRTSAS